MVKLMIKKVTSINEVTFSLYKNEILCSNSNLWCMSLLDDNNIEEIKKIKSDSVGYHLTN